MRAATLALLVAGLLAGCAVPPPDPASRAATCIDLYRDYERALRFQYPYTSSREDAPGALRAEVSRLVVRLVRNDCLTFAHDLEDLVGLRMELAGRVPPPGGSLPPTAVQAGVVTGIGAEIATLQFFRGLGYGARSLDAPGLGRRIYIGPFTSEAQIKEALAMARRAGFVAPHPSATFRFGVIPSLL